MNKKRQINFLDNEIEPYIFKQEKHVISLKYDRHNESYDVIKEKLCYDDEPHKTFKDYIANGLDPTMPSNSTYGVAPTLEPLNKTIEKAKETLNTFTLKKQELEQQIQQLEQQSNFETIEKGEPTND